MIWRLAVVSANIEAGGILRQPIGREFHFDAGLPHPHIIGVQRGGRERGDLRVPLHFPLPTIDPRRNLIYRTLVMANRQSRAAIPLASAASCDPAGGSLWSEAGAASRAEKRF